MSGRVLHRLRIAASVYASLTFVALLLIAVWCTWHSGYCNEGIESRVVTTWFWLGLIPTTAVGAIAIAPWEVAQ